VAEVAVSVLTTGSIFFVLGIPFAFAVRRREEGWVPLAIDSALLGTVFATLAVTLWSWLSIAGIVLAAALVAGALAWVLVRRPGLPARPGRPSWILVGLWVAIIAVAVLLRLHDSTFLPWVGDMGAYVNWANEFVRLGELKASWPPIFPVFLGISTAIFGTAGTTSGIAWCGFLLLGAVVRVLGLLHVGRWVVAGVTGALALNVHAIWYSYFPSSESLNAPVFLTWIALLIATLRAERRDLPPLLVLTALVMLHLGLLRGSGSFLLAPLLIVAVLAVLIPVWRTWAPRLWLGFIASLVGAEVSIWYGISVIPRYFIDMQLRMLTPASLFTAADSAGVFDPGPIMLGMLVAVLAIAFAGLAWSRRAVARRQNGGETATTRLAWVAAGALAAGIALEGIVGANVWFILARSGLWIVIGAILGLIAIARRRTTTDVVPAVALLALSAMILIAFHTNRLGNNRSHSFFMYWDRYLVSEVIPALVVVAGVGIAWLATALAPRLRAVRMPRWRALPALLVAAGVVLSALPSIPILARETTGTYMAGAYEFEQRLMSHADRDDALMWSATAHGYAPGFFFPNTWMAFAIPMVRSFGYEFLNVDQGEYNFGPDDILDRSELLGALEEHPELLVYETQMAVGSPLGERIDDPRIRIERVGEEVSDISLLKQSPELQDWTRAEIRVVIWRVTRDG
jgi:hypothetical protein